MPLLIELAKIIISIFIVGSIGVSSFLGFGLQDAEHDTSSPFHAEETAEWDLKKVDDEKISDMSTLPELFKDELPPPQPPSAAAEGGWDERVEAPSLDDNLGLPETVLSEAVVETLPPDNEAASKTTLLSTPGELFLDVPFSDINLMTRKALVNILCTSKTGGFLRPISGSGVVIDERGVILTNAHIAQFFLLKDYPEKDALTCVIRNGSPAKSAYEAQLLYISPAWIRDNADLIKSENPLGTGENDFAFLLVSAPINTGTSLPTAFSYVIPDMDERSVTLGTHVVLVGYPAGFLSGASIQKDLYAASAVVSIRELFTFVEGTLDLFSVGGSVVAQQGSSGGAVVNTENKLIGIIVTSSVAENTDDRDLRAITISHIDRSLKTQTGFGLGHLLFGDLRLKAGVFRVSTAPQLADLLVSELDR